MSTELAPLPDGDVESKNGAEKATHEEVLANSIDSGIASDSRVIKKAKRNVQIVTPTVDGVDTPQIPSINNNKTSQPFTKNSRKSRNAVGRGLPKKGGAGGKGTWGAAGQVVDPIDEDANDPNYDSDNDTEEIVMKVVLPVLTDDELEKIMSPILTEYLENGEIHEVIDTLLDLNIGENRHRIIGSAIALAMERHDPNREMMSQLISDLYGEVLQMEDMRRGFDFLLESLPDLTLDTPEAPGLLGRFIARAVADDCLPPKYVSSHKGRMDCIHGRQALDKADVLLNMKHGLVRLDEIWGAGGGNRPVKYLKKKMLMLLKEYLSSGDMDEATRCLKELDVPHFHHEIVYEGIVMAIEESTERASELIVKLLKYFYSSSVVTCDCMNKGIRRVYEEISDIAVDVPNAYQLLDDIGNHLHAEGVLSEELYKDMPSRGRKRFVSEGDGGRLKGDQK